MTLPRLRQSLSRELVPDWELGEAQAMLLLARRVFLMVGVIVPAFGVFGFLYGWTPTDPFWPRLLIAAVAFGLFGLTYVSAWVRRHARFFWHLLLFGVTIWFILVAASVGFQGNYALATFLVTSMCALSYVVGPARTRPLVVYFAVSVGLTAAALWLAPELHVSPASFIGYLLCMDLAIYMVARGRIHIQQTLRGKETHLAAAQHLAGMGSWSWSLTSGRAYWSDEMYHILGLARTSVAPSVETFLDLVHPDDGPALRERWEALQHGAGEESSDFRIIRPDGETRYLRDRIVMAFDGRGRPVRAHGIIMDVTAQKEYEMDLVAARERAEAASRAKSSFLANMSHEIRTPLTGILGFAEILVEHTESEHDREMLVQPILTGGRRLLETLNSVLDLARLEAGKVELRPERFEAVAEVREVLTYIRGLAVDKGLALSFDASAEQVHVFADRTAFVRILNNLVGNAVKFTEHGGVRVRVEGDGRRVRVTVSDTGIGIGAEFLPSLFEEFGQESSGIGRHHEGSGLGLAITKQLVTLMGGRIDVESEKGAGTTFTVELPRRRPALHAGPVEWAEDLASR